MLSPGKDNQTGLIKKNKLKTFNALNIVLCVKIGESRLEERRGLYFGGGAKLG